MTRPLHPTDQEDAAKIASAIAALIETQLDANISQIERERRMEEIMLAMGAFSERLMAAVKPPQTPEAAAPPRTPEKNGRS